MPFNIPSDSGTDYAKHHYNHYNRESFEFSWQTVDHPGVWAFGGTIKELQPVLLGVTVQIPQSEKTEGWWCYIGPEPVFTNPPNPNLSDDRKQVDSAYSIGNNFTGNFPTHKM